MAVGSANEEGDDRRALVEMTRREGGEIIARQCLAALIEDDGERSIGNGAGKETRLPPSCGSWRPAVSIREIARADVGYTAGPPKAPGTLQVVVEQRQFGPGLQPADGENVKLHSSVKAHPHLQSRATLLRSGKEALRPQIAMRSSGA